MNSISVLAFAIGTEISDLISQTGLIAKLVLLLLLAFSLLSWTIIAAKWGLFRRAKVQSARFVNAFRRAGRMQEMVAVAEQFRPSPLVPVFQGAVEELRRQGGSPRPTAVQRATQIASSEELSRLESRLPWLATTGSVSPFVGLFGTVWGIIDAFHGLGGASGASLRAVAPGISEALITTAAGLFAAIPAVIAYNYFLGEIRHFGARMDDFSLELLNNIERSMEQRVPERANQGYEPR
jgi:biopolymer transport protein TolQ